MMKFKFYADAGHGWLAVKRDLLEKFGLLNNVSHYSYQRGKTVYLEEDDDASMFLVHLASNNISFTLEEKHTERSPIRSYDHFAN